MTVRRRVAVGYGCMVSVTMAVVLLQAVALHHRRQVQQDMQQHLARMEAPGPAVDGSATDAQSHVQYLSEGQSRLRVVSHRVFVGLVVLCAVGAILALYFYWMLSRDLDRGLGKLQAGLSNLAAGAGDTLIDYPWNDEFRECAEHFNKMAVRLQHDAKRLVWLASRDPLTNLLNRRMFIDQLTREIRLAHRVGRNLCLIMIDLDHFKQINDRYGHAFGDRVLSHIGARFQSLVRESDYVGRLGGEELAILLPGADLTEAKNVAGQLRTSLACEELPCGSELVRLSASFGVAELDNKTHESPDDLLRRADHALYAAKDRGRDTVVTAETGSGNQIWQGHSDSDLMPEFEKDGLAAQQKLSLDRDTLALIGSMFTLLHVMPDKKRVAADLVEQVAAVLQCKRVTLLLIDPHNSEMSVAAAHGLASDDLSVRIPVVGSFFEAILGSDDENKAGWQRMPPDVFVKKSDSEDVSSEVIYVPLVLHGEPLGLVVATERPGSQPISKRQLTILRALSAVGSVALKNCTLYADIEEQWVGSIRALSNAIDANDPYTRNHSARVALLSVRIGRQLGIRDDAELRSLQLSGLLHDIGKIGVPGSLVQKSAKLSRREYRAVQEHSSIGARILEDIPRLKGAAQSILHHHEWFNGNGYPDGLAGEDIPLTSRILSVADAFDAMTSKRPYRKAMPSDEAIKKIQQQAGTQFDSAVVEAFVNSFNPSTISEMQMLLETSPVSTEQVLAAAE